MVIFPEMGGRGQPNSQYLCVITIALKTPLTHLKVTQKFPTWKKTVKKFQNSQKGERRWGPPFGKNSQKIPFFLEVPPYSFWVCYRTPSICDLVFFPKSGLNKMKCWQERYWLLNGSLKFWPAQDFPSTCCKASNQSFHQTLMLTKKEIHWLNKTLWCCHWKKWFQKTRKFTKVLVTGP